MVMVNKTCVWFELELRFSLVSHKITRTASLHCCYDMEVGENRVRVFCGTEKERRRKIRDIYREL